MIGSCLCGDVEFEVRGPYPRLYQCHCSLCRKQGGSVSSTGMIVATDRFRWLSGESRVRRWQRSTGFRSHFCATCGSPVPNPLRDTGYVWIPTGLLDDDGPLEVAAQLHIDSRAPWAVLSDAIPKFAEAPEMAELISMLHGQPGRLAESAGRKLE